jgi:hypothetical protein
MTFSTRRRRIIAHHITAVKAIKLVNSTVLSERCLTFTSRSVLAARVSLCANALLFFVFEIFKANIFYAILKTNIFAGSFLSRKDCFHFV